MRIKQTSSPASRTSAAPASSNAFAPRPFAAPVRRMAEGAPRGVVQRKLNDAIIYAVYAGLNHKWMPGVKDFVDLLIELTPSHIHYEGLKKALLKGMPFEEASAVEKQLAGPSKMTFGELDLLESDIDDEDFEMDYEVTSPKKSTKKPTPDTLSTFDMFKPKASKSKKKPSAKQSSKLEARDQLSVKGGFLQRPKEYGPVTVEKESISHVSGQTIQRPVHVSGLVYPGTTSGRPSAPEPSSGIKVGVTWKLVGAKNTRNTGIVDAQKGHIMALELGGPDLSSNIVPQWGNWQANGAWREAEKKILALAQTVEKKGHKLLFDAEILYKQYAVLEQGTLKGLTFPSGFKVTVFEVDKSQKPVSSGQVMFNGEQAQDETDYKVSGKVFDQVDSTVFVEEDDVVDM
jgi:hypothetical protein